MQILLKNFSELSSSDAFKILKLRQDIFIIEQACIYPDIDGSDEKAQHLMVTIDSELVAYCRIFAPGTKFEKESSIGRILVKKSHRGGNLGPLLINEAIAHCRSAFPDSSIKIEAQAALEKYYHQFGFTTTSEVYSVDDIDHIEMRLQA